MENCNNCENKQACVPYFVHEGIMDHYSRANKRMLIALITVCVAGLIGIGIFVHGNTIREKQLIDMKVEQIISEVQNAKETAPPGV